MNGQNMQSKRYQFFKSFRFLVRNDNKRFRRFELSSPELVITDEGFHVYAWNSMSFRKTKDVTHFDISILGFRFCYHNLKHDLR